MDSSVLDKAIKFAVDAHSGVERRGKEFPYIVHPMEAVSIVSTITSDQDLLAAAALHDVVEDTDISIDTIREEFGDHIAELVMSETDRFDPNVSEAEGWHARKQASIDRLAAASLESKIVAIGDKLSNLRAIWRDYSIQGEKFWNLFHVKERSEHEWHYRGLQFALSELAGTFAYKEYCNLMELVFSQEQINVEKIDISDYTHSGEGVTAESFNRNDGKTMIKLYNANIDSSVPETEYRKSRQIEELGLRIPKAYRVVTDGKRIGVEFERIRDKKSFSRAIADNPEKMEELVKRFAAMAKDLHGRHCSSLIFNSVKEHHIDSVRRSPVLSDKEKIAACNFIFHAPDASTCLHGDMHIGNAIFNGDGEYWIDLSDFRYGAPQFDLGMFHLVCNIAPSDRMQEIFHLSSEQLKEIWRIFIGEYCSKTPEEVDMELRPYAALMLIFFSNRSTLKPMELEFVHSINWKVTSK